MTTLNSPMIQMNVITSMSLDGEATPLESQTDPLPSSPKNGSNRNVFISSNFQEVAVDLEAKNKSNDLIPAKLVHTSGAWLRWWPKTGESRKNFQSALDSQDYLKAWRILSTVPPFSKDVKATKTLLRQEVRKETSERADKILQDLKELSYESPVSQDFINQLVPQNDPGSALLTRMIQEAVHLHPKLADKLQLLADYHYVFCTDPARILSSIHNRLRVEDYSALTHYRNDKNSIFFNLVKNDTPPSFDYLMGMFFNEMTNAIPRAQWHQDHNLAYNQKGENYPKGFADLEQEINGTIVTTLHLLHQENQTDLTVQKILEKIGESTQDAQVRWLGPTCDSTEFLQSSRSLQTSALIYSSLVYGEAPLVNPSIPSEEQLALNDAGFLDLIKEEDKQVAEDAKRILLSASQKIRNKAKDLKYDYANFRGNSCELQKWIETNKDDLTSLSTQE